MEVYQAVERSIFEYLPLIDFRLFQRFGSYPTRKWARELERQNICSCCLHPAWDQGHKHARVYTHVRAHRLWVTGHCHVVTHRGSYYTPPCSVCVCVQVSPQATVPVSSPSVPFTCLFTSGSVWKTHIWRSRTCLQATVCLRRVAVVARAHGGAL